MAKSTRTGKYTQSDARRDTGATRRQTSEAHHQARTDAAKAGGWGVPKNRHKK